MHSIPTCDDCLSELSDPEEDFQPLTPPGLDLPTNSVVTFLSPISSPSKIPSNPASPDGTPTSPLPSIDNLANIIPEAASSPSAGLHFSFSLPEDDQFKTTEELPLFSSLLSDVRPLLSRPNHLKPQLDHAILGRQHRREHYTNHTRRTKQPRFNQHLQYSLKPKFPTWEKIFWDSRRQEYTFPSTSLPSQRLVVPPQAITGADVAQPSGTCFHPELSIFI